MKHCNPYWLYLFTVLPEWILHAFVSPVSLASNLKLLY